MSPRVVLCFTVLLLFTSSCSGARILGFFGIPSISHQVVYRAFMIELAQRGHNVTVITTDPINKPLENYHEIDISYSYDIIRREVDVAASGGWLLRNVPEVFVVVFLKLMNQFCEVYLSDPNIARIIETNEQFDMFIVEFGPMMCTYPFANQSNNLMVGILSLAFGTNIHFAFGSTANTAYVPEPLLANTDQMNTFQRLRLLILQAVVLFISPFAIHGQQEIADQYFGSGISDLKDYALNVSILLQNTHPSTGYPNPLSPAFVNIGGPPLHLWKHKAKELSTDLQEFMDGAEHGVIYFSLGSNVKSSTMPEAKRSLFLNAFRRIKQRVLWKWETDDLPGKPDNVKVQKWLPQTDVLAHPNVKAFITQGGLQSMGEATHFEVPLVVIPFFADQELNAKKLESVGVAITLDFESLTEEDIYRAVTDIVQDAKYKEAMIKYADLTRDQPQSPMERAVWWVEYVLRHKGAQHLRSAAVDLPWYQYFMLDVLAFLAAILGVVLYILHFIASRLFRLAFRRQKTKSE